MKVTNTGWHFTRLLNSPLEDEGLTSVQKMVFVALSYFMDQKGNGAHPSYQTIAKVAGCGRRTAVLAINALEEKGYIIKQPRWNAKGDCTSNDYIIPTQTDRKKDREDRADSAEGSASAAPPSESDALPLVQEEHHPSASAAPKLEPMNENQLNENRNAPRKAKKSKPERSSEDKELYESIKAAFLWQNDDQFSNWGKEGKHIWGIVDRVKARSPDTPDVFAHQMLEVFWRLKKSRDRFWSGQPFLASALNATGNWDRVLEAWRQRKPAEVSEEEFERLAGMF
jgi:DNA-binding MarR family transcriptional regulator